MTVAISKWFFFSSEEIGEEKEPKEQSLEVQTAHMFDKQFSNSSWISV